jgi:phosphoribosyl 1,2-cyclic phosphate phosphodiesterase
VDAVFFTHGHADHILGLDDLRPFNFLQSEAIPVYASEETLTIIRRVFAYIFHAGESQSSRPRIRAHAFSGAPIDVAGLSVMPVPLLHGRGTCHGFRFGKAAYLTDHSEVPEESLSMLENLDVLFLDALRYKPHPTHSTVEQSLQIVERLKPRQTWFTHIAHDLPHERAERLLPAGVRLAYDGLEVVVDR